MPLKNIKLKETTTNGHSISFCQMMERSYTNFSEFFMDIEWFAYECGTQHPSEQSTAAKLIQFVIEDVHSILTCKECYNNIFTRGESSFILPCEKPHLLVWADAEDYGFWPAKVMKVTDDSINLRFFGDHTTENLAVDSCFLYSNDRPNDSKVSNLDTYSLALKVRFD